MFAAKYAQVYGREQEPQSIESRSREEIKSKHDMLLLLPDKSESLPQYQYISLALQSM